MNGRYHVERLPNGHWRITDRRCQWSGLYTTNGSYRDGPCQLLPEHARRLIAEKA